MKNFTKSLFVALLLLCSTVANAHDFVVDGIYYNITDATAKTVEVTYKSSHPFYSNEYSGSVSIPSTVTYSGTTYSVTSIRDYAFNGCTGLTSIIIPNSVTSIGDMAFLGCTGLTSITIPVSVTNIGDSVFSGCSGLENIVVDSGNTIYDSRDNCNSIIETTTNALVAGCKSTNIPNSVTSIGNYAFSGCTGLTSVTIPNSVTSIGNYAFSFCTGLTSVTIGNSVTSIGEFAFSGCDGLTSVTIPNSVTSIGNYAFYNCKSLTSVTIPNSVTSIGENAFSGCTGLKTVLNCSSLNIVAGATSNGYVAYYATKVIDAQDGSIEGDFVFAVEDGVNTLFAYIGSDSEITLPANYNGENYVIGASVFESNTSITSVTIPNSVTSIGNYAFSFCTGLTSVTIGNSVTSIGEFAFSGCDGLTSVTIPNSVTSIGSYAFNYCTGLTSVTIPNSVTSIGSYAFNYCTGLTSVTIGNGVTSIGNYAFNYCDGLKTVLNCSSLNIVAGATSNGYVAYYADKVTNVQNGSIEGDFVFAVKDGVNTLFAYIGSDSEITLPANYNGENYVIGKEAFYRCTGLTSVTIPNSVTSIGIWAFSGCTGLTSVTIPNSVTSIGYRVFQGCTGLTSVTIPNSVTSIGEDAFNYCTGLTSVTIPNSVTSIGNYAFYNCKSLTSVTIPNSVTSIGEDAFYYCKSLKVVYNNSSLNIVAGATDNGCVAYYANAVIVPGDDTYQTIGDYVFRTIDGVNTLIGYVGGDSEITLPDNYKGENYVIGEKAFFDCTGLTSVTIGNSVTSIGNYAFWCCDGLTSVTIPNSVTSIGSSAFDCCTGLKSVTIPNSVTSIGYRAFDLCTGLTSVTIPNSVTSIGSYAFDNCTGLTSVTIGNGVTSIGNYAFRYCSGLTRFNILSEKINNGVLSTLVSYNKPFYVPGFNTASLQTSFPSSTFKNILSVNIINKSINSLEFSIKSNYSSLVIKKVILNNEEVAKKDETTYIATLSKVDTYDVSAVCEFEGKEYTLCGTINNAPESPVLKLQTNTQTTLTLKITNINYPSSATEVGVIYGGKYYKSSNFDTTTATAYVTIKGFSPDNVYSVAPYAKYNDYIVAGDYKKFNTLPVTTSSSVAISATTITFNGYYNVGDATIVDYGFTGYQSNSNELILTGLEPNTSYSASFFVTTKEGGTVTQEITATTDTLVFSTLPAKATSDRRAVICAEANIANEETGAGFEWRRIDAPDLVPSSYAACAIHDGVIEGALNNLSASTYYKYRPYYCSEAGNYYYGEWIGFGTADAYVYFTPTVYTYVATQTANSAVYLKGYALAGSDEILEQGFEYWIDSAAKTRASNNVMKVVATGQRMSVLLEDLEAERTYKYRAFATTEKETVYGDEQTFTTPQEEIFGDVDGDGTVDAADATSIVDMILDQSLYDTSGDVDGDEVIDVADVTTVVSVILGTNNTSDSADEQEAYSVKINAEGDKNTLNISTTTDYPYSAVQFDVYLPDGVTATGNITTTGNAAYQEQADGAVRVVIFSLSNNSIADETITLPINTDALGEGSHSVEIKNITLSAAGLAKAIAYDSTGYITIEGSTGIDTIEVEGEGVNEIYDLSGRRVEGTPKKGVYIINGKKVFIK